MEKRTQELLKRAAFLAAAIEQLPSDAITVAALFDEAVSTAIAVTFDPAAARIMFEARMVEYECKWSAVGRQPTVSH
jgi:hypothetical protein